MKLIGSYASPFVRKARIVLAEKRIEYEFVVDNPNDTDSRVSDFNPLGKVPVLVTNDGATIYDSSVIVEHVDAISPVGWLIPEPVANGSRSNAGRPWRTD
jgi:glutathione S-transferase